VRRARSAGFVIRCNRLRIARMTKPPPGSPAELRRATVALTVLSLIWGYNWIAMKVALDYATPIDAAAVRFALGALALLPAAHFMGYGLLIPRKEWRLVGILSVSLAANFAFTLRRSTSVEWARLRCWSTRCHSGSCCSRASF